MGPDCTLVGLLGSRSLCAARRDSRHAHGQLKLPFGLHQCRGVRRSRLWPLLSGRVQVSSSMCIKSNLVWLRAQYYVGSRDTALRHLANTAQYEACQLFKMRYGAVNSSYRSFDAPPLGLSLEAEADQLFARFWIQRLPTRCPPVPSACSLAHTQSQLVHPVLGCSGSRCSCCYAHEVVLLPAMMDKLRTVGFPGGTACFISRAGLWRADPKPGALSQQMRLRWWLALLLLLPCTMALELSGGRRPAPWPFPPPLDRS